MELAFSPMEMKIRCLDSAYSATNQIACRNSSIFGQKRLSMSEITKIGAFQWADLTVPNALAIKDFYANVIGFTVQEVPMDGYEDFCLNSPTDGFAKAGVCHAKGANTDLPPVWLVYFNVADLDQSLKSVEDGGGKIISGPKSYGETSRYAVIQDPAGAFCALFQH